ncbi:hypothetical protein QBC35DRAFT_274187 [Podospora australis]|uniref:Uncharacterized protein n=1 Tax=Podospora australis TaxID=1536484 RepID=A0AAN6WTS1_9PEZI|nr:hypothetical protein QBC35DRAFT_274187 [Podospora australis]
MLPEPSITFTVPSLHDGLPINCRVYHPASLAASPSAPPWKKHTAIFAHPYAPLGGSYDDHVVDAVAGTLLRMGFLVGTFNFRGARGSAGKTSWTAKAERGDYMAVVGFLAHYVHFLDPFRRVTIRLSDTPIREDEIILDGSSVSKIRVCPPDFSQGTSHLPNAAQPVFLLGGYSYGSMIASQLPYLETILSVFETPECGSTAAEVRLRAEHLAEKENTLLASARIAVIDQQAQKSPRRALGLRIGGDEDNRKSHESRRPMSVELEEKIRHGVEELMAKTKKGQKKTKSSQVDGLDGVMRDTPKPEVEHLLPVLNRTTYQPAYLLVSPLQGVVTNLATMSMPTSLLGFGQRAWNRLPARTGSTVSQSAQARPAALRQVASPEAEDKLVKNQTLAIYGDSDGFVSARRLRQWASRLEGIPGSQFRAHEVSGANHFWNERKAAFTLRDAVRTFVESVLKDDVLT